MSKHTAGPWILKVERGTGGSITYAIHDQDGYEIHWFNDSGAKPQVQEKEKKIAHLIAVAPDMYEALKAVEDAVAEHLLLGERFIPEKFLQKITKAIAKAEGRDD